MMKYKSLIFLLAAVAGLSVLPAGAETFCTGASAPVRVDSRTGQVREAAPVETLTYNANYVKSATQGASVDIAVNGTVEWQGLTGVGAVQWTTPSTPGTYTLQHAVKDTGGGVITNLTAEFRVLAVVAEPTAVAHATAVVTYDSGDPVATNNQGQIVAPVDAQMKVTYQAEKDYYFQNGADSWSAGFRVDATATTPPKPEIEPRQLVEVDYVDEKGTSCRTKALVLSSTSQTLTLKNLDVSFFVVTNDVVMASGISFLYRNGRPHFILSDGATLQVRGAEGLAGISSNNPDKDAAYVYGQRLGTGKLSICGGRNAPGLAAKLVFASGTGVISGSEGFSALANTVRNLNSSLTVRAGNDRHAQTILGQEGWYTVKTVAGMRYLTIAPELPTVTVLVEQTSRKIYVDGVEAVQGMVWSNQAATVVYTAGDGYMFASGETEMTFALDTTKSPAEIVDWRDPGKLVKAWEETRTLAVDTRARIIVNAPDQVLPIAYSTNHWGEALAGQEVTITSQRASDPSVTVVDKARVNGYGEWMPEQAVYGAYRIRTENKLGIGGTFATDAHLYYGADYQLMFEDDLNIFVQVNRTDKYGLGNLEDVTSYTVLQLTATPEYTNVDRYEFAGWKVYSYAERDIGWKTAVEAPELLKNFGDASAAETTFEMPFTNVFLTCSYQWKSNYAHSVCVKAGVDNAWEIHEGETYVRILTDEGSIVSFRGTVNPKGEVEIVANATNIWDFAKGGRPCFIDYDRNLRVSSDGVRLIVFDETLTNGVYTIATKADTAVGGLFVFVGSGVVACEVAVGDGGRNVGAVSYTLSVDDSGCLLLSVADATYPVAASAVNGSVDLRTNGVLVVAGDLVAAHATVALEATPAVYYDFRHWGGTDGAGNELSFADVSNAVTTFMMPVTNAMVTAVFALSESYRAAQTEFVSNAFSQAVSDIGSRIDLADDEKAVLLKGLETARSEALALIDAADSPAQIQSAVAAAEDAIARAREEADKTSDGMVRFAQSGFETEGGMTLDILVYGGSMSRATAVTLNFIKGSYVSKPNVYVGGARVKFPLVLNWAKGERTPKVVSLQIPQNRSTDQSFTLQLGSGVATSIGMLNVASVTVRGERGRRTTAFVRALAWPANAGTVTGAGELANAKAYRTLTATAKSYATFVGWYKASEEDPNVIDLGAPVSPLNPRNPKQIRVGYDSSQKQIVNQAGTYFAYFTNVLEVSAVVEPQAFDPDTGKPLPNVAGVVAQDAVNGVYETMVGVKFALPVEFTDASGKGKLTVTKLPNGLSYNAKEARIIGVPTKACTNTVTFTASNAAGKHMVTYLFVVGEMPAQAIGSFNGVICDDDARAGVGSVRFSAGKTGALSAKVTRRQAGARSFSVKGYDYVDDGTFAVAMTNAQGEVFEATLSLTNELHTTALVGAAFGGDPKKTTLAKYGETNGAFSAVRNAFKASEKNVLALQALESYRGTYKAKLLDAVDDTEIGTVEYRVQEGGNVYVLTKLAKGVSAAGKIIPAKTFSGSAEGAFRIDSSFVVGGCEAALRSGTSIWSTFGTFDAASRAAHGSARYIRVDIDDKDKVLDEVQRVGD